MSQNKKFNYGGQAVIEGVMMRGGSQVAVAVRNPEGEIVIREEPINSALYNGIWSKIPFIRGMGLLWDALGLGTRALTYSADVAVGDEAEFSGPVAWGTIAFSLGLGTVLFFLLPAAAADGLHSLLGLESALLSNLIEGLIRLVIVIAYIWGIGQMADIKRLWGYHGAEHKTINAYEDGAELSVESIARYPLEHPRCGTGFLLVVVAISVLVFSFLGRPPILIRLATRVIFVPVIAGIAYEYIRLLAANLDKPIARLLVKPQLWLQRLTTAEPEPEMIEVALTAFQCVLQSAVAETSPVEAVASS